MARRVLSVFLAGLTFVALAVPAGAQEARTVTIPEGAKARLALQTQISSKLNEVGDAITAVVYEPVRIDGYLALPRGTEFEGRITSIKPAGHGQKQSQMTIVFERVILPYGSEPVSVRLATIDDYNNDSKLKANPEGKVKGGHSGKETADSTVKGAEIGGAGAGVIYLSGGNPAAAAGVLGASMLGGLLLTKGKEIRLNPGTIFRVEFVHPITVPAQDQEEVAPRPGDGRTSSNEKFEVESSTFRLLLEKEAS